MDHPQLGRTMMLGSAYIVGPGRLEVKASPDSAFRYSSVGRSVESTCFTVAQRTNVTCVFTIDNQQACA